MLKGSKRKVRERAYVSTWSSTAESNQYMAMRETGYFFEAKCSS